ncbi:Co-chaperone [Cryptotrichosporon argae]
MSTDPTAPKPLTAYQQTYHWRNKNCGPWAHDWVRRSLPGTRVADADGARAAELTAVSDVGGDCDLGQRKGKLLTIYDLEADAEWKASAEGGDEVTGKLKITEFSHEAIDGLGDYVFDFSLSSAPTAESAALLAYAREALPPALTALLNTFRPALLSAHGLFADAPSPAGTPVSGASGAASSSYSPAPPAPAESASKPSTPAPAQASTAKALAAVGPTSTVEVSAELQASAADLFALLTDAAKIPMWARAPAAVELRPGGRVELFGGNVVGEIKEVEQGEKVVQTWATKSTGWPAGHYGTLTITLNQGSDFTKVVFTLDGVPAGKEADLERAIDTFYIRGLGSIL